MLSIARPMLQHLVEVSQETVSLCVLQDDHGVCLANVDSPQSMRFTIRPGESFPLNAGCVGKVILAFQPQRFIDSLLADGPLPRFTDRTLVAPATLGDELTRIRAQGWALSEQQLELGMRGIAVPLIDHRGDLLGALNVTMPMGHESSEDAVRRVLPVLQETARAMRNLL